MSGCSGVTGFRAEPKAEVFKALREAEKTTVAEESELLEEISTKNPWKGVLTALRDSKRRVAESVPVNTDVKATLEEDLLAADELQKLKNTEKDDEERESNRSAELLKQRARRSCCLI